jgi:signal transduction histidine kinase
LFSLNIRERRTALKPNVRVALTKLMTLGFASACQELAEAIRDEIKAIAVEVRATSHAYVAKAGEIPSWRPVRFALQADARTYGSLALWSTAALDESVIDEIQFVTHIVSLVLERDSFRRDADQFVYSLTHDLRAILVRASNMAQLLGKTGQLTGDGPELYKYLTDNLAAGDSLLRQVVAYATAGRSHDLLRELRVTTITDAVRWNVKPELVRKGARLLIEDGDLTVQACEHEIVDALQRVVENSIKFGASEIIVRSTQSDGGVLISIDDDGPGVEPAYFDAVFEPFKRLHGSSIPGHGLGLTIARKIVELHGGHMWLEAPSGRGTAVRTWLPTSSPNFG